MRSKSGVILLTVVLRKTNVSLNSTVVIVIGCLRCNNPETMLPHLSVEVKFLHQETLARQAFIESLGYTVTNM